MKPTDTTADHAEALRAFHSESNPTVPEVSPPEMATPPTDPPGPAARGIVSRSRRTRELRAAVPPGGHMWVRVRIAAREARIGALRLVVRGLAWVIALTLLLVRACVAIGDALVTRARGRLSLGAARTVFARFSNRCRDESANLRIGSWRNWSVRRYVNSTVGVARHPMRPAARWVAVAIAFACGVGLGALVVLAATGRTAATAPLSASVAIAAETDTAPLVGASATEADVRRTGTGPQIQADVAARLAVPAADRAVRDLVPAVGAAVPEAASATAAAEPAIRRSRPYRGHLVIRSLPSGARVFVNNEFAGQTPLVIRNERAGSRAIRLTLDGHADWSRGVDIVANRSTTVVAQLHRGRTR